MSTATPNPSITACTLQVAVLGDPGIGKSNLITTYVCNYYTSAYIPTVLEIYTKDLTLILNNSRQTLVQLVILDLGGSEKYDRIRELSFLTKGSIDVFILCLKLGDDKSCQSIGNKWKDIKDHVGRDIPVVLVGLAAGTSGDSPRFNWEETAKLAGASAYVECSPLRRINIREVFKKAVTLGMVKREKDLIDEKRKGKWEGRS